MLRSPRLPSSKSWSPRKWKGFRKNRKRRKERLTKEHSGSCRDIRGAVCEEDERANFIRTRPSLWDIDILRKHDLVTKPKSESSPLKKFDLIRKHDLVTKSKSKSSPLKKFILSNTDEEIAILLCATSEDWSTSSSTSDFVPVKLIPNLSTPEAPMRTSSDSTTFLEQERSIWENESENISSWKLHSTQDGHHTLRGLGCSNQVLVRIECS